MNSNFTSQATYLRIDERNNVENPLLDQLDGLSWEVIDLDSKQRPGDSFRESFTEVVMLKVLRAQLKIINEWLEDDQVEEVVKQIAASFPGSGLIAKKARLELEAKTGKKSLQERIFYRRRQSGN